jgi:hypothetical protein
MDSLGKSQIDIDDLRIILTEIDGGRPPLPKDLLWAMTVGDKDHSQKISHGELAFILKVYAKHMEEVSDITALIKKYDKNEDLKLDDDEMEALLKEAVGVASVSGDDVNRVRVLFDKYSAGHETKGIDPLALAKAISVWDDEANLSEGMFAHGFVPGMPELKLPEFPDMSKTWEDAHEQMSKSVGGIFSSHFFEKMCTPEMCSPACRAEICQPDVCTPQETFHNPFGVTDDQNILFEMDGSTKDRSYLDKHVFRNHRLNK